MYSDEHVVVLWTRIGVLHKKMTQDVQIWGTVAFGCMCLLAVCSLPAVRRWSFTIFFHCHWIGFTVLPIAVRVALSRFAYQGLMDYLQVCFHVPMAVPYAIAAACIYVLDLVLRMLKSHFVRATIHFIPEMASTKVSIPNLRKGWRAGQHVRLTVLSTGMGPCIIESHPFTIASTSDEDEGLVLYCKKAGDWTARLSILARNSMTAKSSRAGLGAGRNVAVIVQGPYGGPGHAVFSSYSAAMIVCGGSGITFGLAAVKEIMRDAFDRKCRVRLVDLVWIVRDHGAYFFNT